MWKDLRDKYGGNSAMALQRAVRAEIAGGNEALDALNLLHQIATRKGGEVGQVAMLAEDRLHDVVDRMREEVLRRYSIDIKE